MNTTIVHDDPYPFKDFAPTLSQCFAIVAIGYLMARFELLKATDLQGVNAFAAYFAMPGIICMSLMDADFEDFRWELLIGIFLGKLSLFILVAGFLLFLRVNAGVAGTVALFTVQSNDLPVGNPLMSFLYRDDRPQMMKYLFLIPAMTVIFFVPISNIMVNIYRKQRNDNQRLHDSKSNSYVWQYINQKEHLNHFRALVKNPVVIATVLGIILNFAFGGKPPAVLHQPIKVAAATIPGLALAILGFNFVRKERYLISSAVVPAMVLLILKMVITPVLMHSILKCLTEESKSTKLLSDFALLYGIISPAVAVFQSGQEFRKSLAIMSVALILTSLCCFPVSYIVARLTIAPVHKLSLYIPELKRILFWTAIISIFSDIVVWISMIWRKHWRLFPGCYIMCLVLTQFLTCCGVLFWSLTKPGSWATYFQMAFYHGGEVSGYIWIGTLSGVLIFKKNSMLPEKSFSVLSFTALGVSVLSTTVMCLLIRLNNVQSVLVVGRARSNFEFLQLTITTILLFISLIVVTICAITIFKRKNTKGFNCYDNSAFSLQDEDWKFSKRIEIPSLMDQPEKLGDSEEARFYYQEVLRNSGCEISLSFAEREWSTRLRNLILIQGMVMLVRLIANSYKLAHNKDLEVIIPMEFLQSILFIGQGIFLLLIFGIDVRTITIKFRKWWRKIRVGADEIPLSASHIEEKEVTQRCNNFYNFNFSRCFRDLAMERRWKDSIYRDSFWGHQLVDWMISEGFCKDDIEAEELGQKLLMGGVIKHVTEKHHFYDAPYLYYFVKQLPEKDPLNEF